jgi:FAD/FMN-containing dehydrogenase
VLLGMGKFNRVLEIDYANRCAVVQPGVTNLGITKAVEHARLLLRARSRPRRSPARSAATSRRIPAACTA